MKKFPSNKLVIDVEALGGEVTLYELNQEYKVECNRDASFDTPHNALLNIGFKEEDILKLGQRVIVDIYKEIIDLTYPNVRAELEQQIKDGTFEEPSEEDVEESKKN